MFSKADGPLDWIVKNGAEIYTMVDFGTKIYDAVGGKSIPDDAPPQAKKLAWSIKNFGDEIDFTRRMLSDGDFEQIEIDAITWFIKRHFIEEPKKNHDTYLASIIAWYRMNQWRLFLMNLDTEPSEVKKNEVEIPPASSKGKSSKKTEFERVGGDEAKRFLKEIAAIINADRPKSKVARYRKVLEHHRVRSIPTMPEPETLKWFEQFFSDKAIKEKLQKTERFVRVMGKRRGQQGLRQTTQTAAAHADWMEQYATNRKRRDATRASTRVRTRLFKFRIPTLEGIVKRILPF